MTISNEFKNLFFVYSDDVQTHRIQFQTKHCQNKDAMEKGKE